MKKIIPILFLTGITLLFFYKLFFWGFIPFPGDLLISEYQPWKSYSFAGYNPGSYPNKAQYFDAIRQLYPWKMLVAKEILSARLPLWNPYNFSGAPLLANLQSAVFYPTTLLFLFLSAPIAWSISVLSQPFFAALSTYAYAKKIGLSTKSALMSGISFGFCLFVTVFLEYNTMVHTILWLPLALWSIESLLQKHTTVHSFIFCFSLVASAFAGHLQLFFLSFAFVCVYICFYTLSGKNKNYSSLVFLLSLSLVAIGIASIQLIPTLELYAQSARVNQPYDFLVNTLLIQPKQLLMMVVPDIFGNPATRNYQLSDSYPGKAMYIGIIPLLFASIAAWHQQKEKRVRFFLGAIGTLLLFLVHTPLTALFYRLNLPIIGTSNPANALFLLSFSLSILAGHGLMYMESHEQKRFILFPTAILTFLGILLVVNRMSPMGWSERNIFLACAITIITLGTFAGKSFVKNIPVITLFLLLVSAADLFYFFGKFNPFVPASFLYPETTITTWLQNNASLDRYWGYGEAGIEANIASYYHLYSPDGYDPLYPKAIGSLVHAGKEGVLSEVFDNTTRSDARIAQGNGDTDFSQNPYRKRILNMLSVAYILNKTENGTTEKTFPPDDFPVVYSDSGWIVHKNTHALARAFLSKKALFYSSQETFEQYFFSQTFDPTQQVLLRENSNGSSPLLDDQEAPITMHVPDNIRIIKYTPNEIVFSVTTGSPQWLVLTDTFYPGWKAFVNKEETSIYQAFWALRAIQIPMGTHTISFEYQPRSFTHGLSVSIFSVCLLLFLCRWMKIKEKYTGV